MPEHNREKPEIIHAVTPDMGGEAIGPMVAVNVRMGRTMLNNLAILQEIYGTPIGEQVRQAVREGIKNAVDAPDFESKVEAAKQRIEGVLPPE